MISGLLVVDKPSGITSHDVVDRIRSLSLEKKVGHAGTLDPLACGVLLILIGRAATKRQSEFMDSEKEYIADIYLGATSSTDDAEGLIEKIENVKEPTEEDITAAIKNFTGIIKQVPPAFSAVKIGGVKAYNAARRGEHLALKSREVTISDIEILEYTYPSLKIKVLCSKGTYIRSLARDIGEILKCGAYIKDLVRTRSGEYSVDNAVALSSLTKENIESHLVKIEMMP